MKKRLITALAIAATATLGLGACSTGTSDATVENGDKQDLTIGVFNGWPEGEAASILWKLILEDEGYNVKLEYADAGPVFAGIAGGDFDVAFDGWLPLTHADYMKAYGADITDLGWWNDEAVLTIAVNSDAPITSLEELAANASKFDNRIVGIEPGAGLTKATQEQVIPGYGLEGMEFLTSSTPAMLAELTAALKNGENIAVTLWRPHWAYDEYDIRDLEDPKSTLGDAEFIHSLGQKNFASDYPQLTKWIKNFKMSSEVLFSLENVLYNSNAETSDYEGIVAKWMTENQDYVDSLTQ